MQEVTRLQINRSRLKEPYFYFDGCETETVKNSEAEADVNNIINLAADVLIDILAKEYED